MSKRADSYTLIYTNKFLYITLNTPGPPGSKKECDKFSGFTCGDGHCILSSYKCDQYEDCKDGSDEFDCKTENWFQFIVILYSKILQS